MKIKVTYEVYRFNKWWKNSLETFMCIAFLNTFTTKHINSILEKEAYENDLGPIRKLTYKEIG